MAGTAAWLVYVAATVALLIVGVNIGKLAARIPCAGSFFIYVSRSLGPSWGLLAGWAMLAAYLTTAMALTVATSLFAKTLFVALKIGFVPSSIAVYAIVSGLAPALRRPRHPVLLAHGADAGGDLGRPHPRACASPRWGHVGFKLDTKQLDLRGIDWSKGRAGPSSSRSSPTSATRAPRSLGKEARDPERVIPRAIQSTRAGCRPLLRLHDLRDHARLRRRCHQARRQRGTRWPTSCRVKAPGSWYSSTSAPRSAASPARSPR